MDKEEYLSKIIEDIKFEMNEIESLINIIKNDMLTIDIGIHQIEKEIKKENNK